MLGTSPSPGKSRQRVDPDVLIEWAEWEGLLALPFELPLSVL